MRDDHASLMLASIMALVLLLPPAYGFTLDMQCVEDNAVNYNRNIENAPYLLTSFLGSEKINLNLVKDNGSLLNAGLDMVDGRIERVIPGGFDNATISFAASERDMNEVIASKEKAARRCRAARARPSGCWAERCSWGCSPTRSTCSA